MGKYILNTTKQGYTKEVRSVYNRRIVEYAKISLEDLALLGETLPEDQLAEVFNKRSLGPLVKAVFRLRIRPNMDDKELSERRKRILELCYPRFCKVLG